MNTLTLGPGANLVPRDFSPRDSDGAPVTHNVPSTRRLIFSSRWHYTPD